LAVKTSKLLRESTLGPFEGKKLDFFLKSLQKSIEYRQTLSDEEKMSYKIHPKVESYEETATRMIAFIREVAVAYPGKRILVVSHAGIIKSSLVKLGFATEDELPDGSISNAGYVVVESDGVDFFVKETQGIKKAYS
jgi:broad specificity phosphatase PhoE